MWYNWFQEGKWKKFLKLAGLFQAKRLRNDGTLENHTPSHCEERERRGNP